MDARSGAVISERQLDASPVTSAVPAGVAHALAVPSDGGVERCVLWNLDEGARVGEIRCGYARTTTLALYRHRDDPYPMQECVADVLSWASVGPGDRSDPDAVSVDRTMFLRIVGSGPKSRLAFGLAALAYNVLNVIEAALAAAHQEEEAVPISTHQLAGDVRLHFGTLAAMIDGATWVRLDAESPARLARRLLRIAGRVDLERLRNFRSEPRRRSVSATRPDPRSRSTLPRHGCSRGGGVRRDLERGGPWPSLHSPTVNSGVLRAGSRAVRTQARHERVGVCGRGPGARAAAAAVLGEGAGAAVEAGEAVGAVDVCLARAVGVHAQGRAALRTGDWWTGIHRHVRSGVDPRDVWARVEADVEADVETHIEAGVEAHVWGRCIDTGVDPNNVGRTRLARSVGVAPGGVLGRSHHVGRERVGARVGRRRVVRRFASAQGRR